VVPGQPLGHIDPKRIEKTIEVMKESYPMKKPVNPKDMYAPGFVE
jgi:NitT/TauT family transport system substrate-binding protein